MRLTASDANISVWQSEADNANDVLFCPAWTASRQMDDHRATGHRWNARARHLGSAHRPRRRATTVDIGGPHRDDPPKAHCAASLLVPAAMLYVVPAHIADSSTLRLSRPRTVTSAEASPRRRAPRPRPPSIATLPDTRGSNAAFIRAPQSAVFGRFGPRTVGGLDHQRIVGPSLLTSAPPRSGPH